MRDARAVFRMMPMRSFARTLFTGLAAVSLLICVASGITEFASRYTRDVRTWRIVGDVRLSLISHLIALHNTRERIAGPTPMGPTAIRRLEWGKFPGDIYYYRFATHAEWSITLPILLPFVLSMILPWIWLHRYRATNQARAHGRCVRCGYDLRATPQRCPECGSVPATKLPAVS